MFTSADETNSLIFHIRSTFKYQTVAYLYASWNTVLLPGNPNPDRVITITVRSVASRNQTHRHFVSVSKVAISWIVRPRAMINRYQRFVGRCCCILQGRMKQSNIAFFLQVCCVILKRWRQYIPRKRRHLSIKLQADFTFTTLQWRSYAVWCPGRAITMATPKRNCEL
jgi:hypothetical protein